MNRSENINELAAALSKAQAAMTNVTKASKAKITMKAGGEYSYTYADLGDICEMLRKPLADNELALMQVPAVDGNGVDVETIVAHSSGQWIACTVGMAVNTGDPKAIGSAITYARRYGMALIGVVTDDDDDAGGAGKSAAARINTQRPVAEKQPPAQPQPAPVNGNGHAHATPADAEFERMTPAVEERKQDQAPTNGTPRKPKILDPLVDGAGRGLGENLPALRHGGRHVQRPARRQCADEHEHRWPLE